MFHAMFGTYLYLRDHLLFVSSANLTGQPSSYTAPLHGGKGPRATALALIMMILFRTGHCNPFILALGSEP